MGRLSRFLDILIQKTTKKPIKDTQTIATDGEGPSKRGQNAVEIGESLERMLRVLGNPYKPQSNQNGYINIGVAENYVMLNNVKNFINEKVHFKLDNLTYGAGATGSPQLKQALAKFWNDQFNPFIAVEPNHVLFASGCTSLAEMIGWTFANRGDAILMSAPMYGTFNVDFVVKAGLHIEHVATRNDHPTSLKSVEYYEEAIVRLQARNIRPRILLLCNPHNPLGSLYDRQTLVQYCDLCARHNLHLISDEVYAKSVFRVKSDSPEANGGPESPFVSLLSLDPTSHQLPQSRLHVMYGFSKDFASGGLRLGCIISQANQDLLSALTGISLMHYVGGIQDQIATTMLNDENWMKSFFAESQKKLKECFSLATSILDRAGIEYIGKGAVWFSGFSLWIDLRHLLVNLEKLDRAELTFEVEDSMVERALAQKVWINSGASFSAEMPGWFRIVFTQEPDILREGLRRLVAILKGEAFANKVIAE